MANRREYHSIFRGCDIMLQKDAPSENWYIIVTGVDGRYRYNGYWRDSANKPKSAALREAKEGACLMAERGSIGGQQ